MKQMYIWVQSHQRWLFPLVWLMMITPLTPQIDLGIERYYFENGHFSQQPFFTFFYNYGCWPALFFSAGVTFLFFVSFLIKTLMPLRNAFLMLSLSFILGSGIIVHALLKDHWGRARPKQVTEFGGNQPYSPFYMPRLFNPETAKSFPCGHCSMGFYFFSLVLLGKRIKNKKIEGAGYCLSLILGLFLSISRMAQGGHFFSDTLCAAYIMWISALCSDWFIYGRKVKSVRVNKKTV